MDDDRVLIRVHAWKRMAERGISMEDVFAVLRDHQRIEDYPEDTPFPSALLFGRVSGRPLHVVAGRDAANKITYVVTVYEPDPAEWTRDFTQRRS